MTADGATASDAHPKVYTPATLARRWQCSERHVRNLIRDGKLAAFRVGGKLLRISAAVVEEFERAKRPSKRRSSPSGFGRFI